ncbi:MAG TPA: pyridoxamine 5'-phosphate oxidase family protein [Candidatus Paceibacterota bacterium]
MDLKKRVREVLEKAHLMSLGTQDESGVWVADVIFIFDDDFKLYWMSHEETRHSKAIHANGKAAGSITASTKSKEPNLGIQFEGEAKKIDGARYDLAVKHYLKRGRLIPPITEDVLDGDSWYVLAPTKIRLIDEEHFGFDTQDVAL